MCPSAILTIDVTSRTVLYRAALPAEYRAPFVELSLASFVPPDGRTLYLFGNSLARPTTARIVAFDSQTGEVRAAVDLPDVLWGERPEAGSPERHTDYQPGLVVSPDGRRGYVVHADSDRVTVVDLLAMRIERSAEIRAQTSLFDRLFSPLTRKAHADGGSPFSEKWASISPDGRDLYIGGGSARVEEGEPWGVGVWPSESYGLRMVATDSLEVVAEIEPGECEYRDLAVHPSGRYLYAATSGTDPGQVGIPRCGNGELLVLDPATLDVLASRTGRGAVLFAPPSPTNETTP